MTAGPKRFSAFLQGALVACAWPLVLGLAMGTVLSRLSVPSWGNPMAEAQSVATGGGCVLGQTFSAHLPGLSGLEVTITATGSTRQQRVTLSLFDGQGSSLLGKEALDLGPGTSAVLRLDLAPLASSQGTRFRFTVESDAPAGQGVSVGYSPSSTLTGSSAFVNGQAVEGNLQFQTYYTLNVAQKAELVLNRLAEHNSRRVGSKGVFVGAALLYAGVLSLFVWQTVHEATAEKRDRS